MKKVAGRNWDLVIEASFGGFRKLMLLLLKDKDSFQKTKDFLPKDPDVIVISFMVINFIRG